MRPFPIADFRQRRTPFYYYDRELLRTTLSAVVREAGRYPAFRVHYAVKANVDPDVLREVRSSGLGCDCVSGGEVQACLDAGFEPSKIVFAGVGKADWEINQALDAGIACLNVESLAELEVIDALAAARGRKVAVALRINPNVDAHTHRYITTGLDENKFGIAVEQLDGVLDRMAALRHVELTGLHFHIGSQVLDMEPFALLSQRINALQDRIERRGHGSLRTINVGGGLGCDYDDPDRNPVPDFAAYFAAYARGLRLRPGQEVHFELGRALVCQCGSLIARVLYIKEGLRKRFAILDAGMSDLIRPALYQAHHRIDALAPDGSVRVADPSRPDGAATYDVVGPVCESSDTFGTDELLPPLRRGDFVALRSAGAYGRIMASNYNCRPIPDSVMM